MDNTSQSARLLKDGYAGCTSERLPQLMDALMADVITGQIPMLRASVACKVASVALKARGTGPATASPAATKSEPEKDMDEIRDEVFNLLDGKAIKPALIAAELSLPLDDILKAIDHEWFDRTPQGIRRAMA